MENIEIKSVADLQVAYDAMKKELETKGAEATKNYDEKMGAIEAAIVELKAVKPEVTAEQFAKMKSDLDVTVKAFDHLQSRVKSGTQASNIIQPVSFESALYKGLEDNTDNIIKMSTKDAGRQKSFAINLNFDTKAVGDVTIANYTGGTRGLTALRPGIITNANRKVHMRDIVKTGTIGAGTEYVFMKENGVGEGAIAAVAEGATKPQFDLDLVEASVKIETLAGWMRVTRKAMSNIQGFVSFLQMRLPQLMLNVEDAQILNGDGVSPNLKGIQVAGNFTAATSLAAAIDIEQLVLGIAQLEGADRTATDIVLNTADYYSLILNKAAGSGEYDLPGVVSTGPDGVLRILGVAVHHTTAQTAGTYLIGDFDNGAQFLIQEGMRIEFFEQDGDNVRTNKVTVRIEETVALPVYGSTYFVKGTF